MGRKESNQTNNNLLYEQGVHRLEKYLNIQECLEKSLKIKIALKSTGKNTERPWKVLEFYYFL